MKHPKFAVVLFSVGLASLVLTLLGAHSIFLAVGIACLLLSYVANRRLITVDPFTGQKLPTPVLDITEEKL